MCSSRNLTFDRSWDTIVVLDGELIDRERAIAANHPLGDFVAALPTMALRPPLPDRVLTMVDRFQDELRRVRFVPPEGFDAVRFWPLGLPGPPRWPFDGRIDRMLVVSPFLAPSLLERLAANGRERILVSRDEALQALGPAGLAGFSPIYVLTDGADPEDEDREETETKSEAKTEAEPEDTLLTGLHAKIYVADSGASARLWTGSANATEAAFGGNVEFLVELEGKRKLAGVDAVLGQEEGVTGLGSLLETFLPGEPVGTDPDQEQLDRLIDETSRTLWSAKLEARVGAGDGEMFSLVLAATGPPPALSPDVQARAWPVTLADGLAKSIVPGSWPVFESLSFEALTSFFAFEVRASVNEQSAAHRFVLSLPLVGAPGDRRERVLRWLLSDRAAVLRLLMLILAEDPGEQGLPPDWPPGSNGSGGAFGTGAERQLFESLVRTLGRRPERLDEVAKLVAELLRDETTRKLLPERFEAIWEPIWAARTRLAP